MDKKENKGGWISNEQLEKDKAVKSKTNDSGHQQGNTTGQNNQPVKKQADEKGEQANGDL